MFNPETKHRELCICDWTMHINVQIVKQVQRQIRLWLVVCSIQSLHWFIVYTYDSQFYMYNPTKVVFYYLWLIMDLKQGLKRYLSINCSHSPLSQRWAVMCRDDMKFKHYALLTLLIWFTNMPSFYIHLFSHNFKFPSENL